MESQPSHFRGLLQQIRSALDGDQAAKEQLLGVYSHAMRALLRREGRRGRLGESTGYSSSAGTESVAELIRAWQAICGVSLEDTITPRRLATQVAMLETK